MGETIDVNTGEVAVSRKGSFLRALALGSCVAVTAYDPICRCAGVAHIMLPGRAPEHHPDKTRYAENGIRRLLELMIAEGCRRRSLEVCLVGAGNVLRKADDTICESNIRSVTGILAAEGLTLRAARLGGFERKSVFIEPATGRVWYTEGEGPKTLLWAAETNETIMTAPQSLESHL